MKYKEQTRLEDDRNLLKSESSEYVKLYTELYELLPSRNKKKIEELLDGVTNTAIMEKCVLKIIEESLDMIRFAERLSEHYLPAVDSDNKEIMKKMKEIRNYVDFYISNSNYCNI